MQNFQLSRPASFFFVAAVVLVGGCASVAVTDDAIQRNTAVTLGVDGGALTISDRENDGVKTTYIAKTTSGKTYNCYVTGTVSVVGRVVSDAVCTESGKTSPSKAPQAGKAPACNALLKTAGKC